MILRRHPSHFHRLFSREDTLHWAQRLAIIYLGALGCSVWGYGVASFNWWPQSIIQELGMFIKGDPEEHKSTVVEKIENDVGGRPNRKLVSYSARRVHPKRKYRSLKLPNQRVRRLSPLIFHSKKASQGLRLIYGSFDHQKGLNGAILLDEQGDFLWEWVISEDGLPWAQQGGAERVFPHGVLIEPDGSLIVAFDNGVSLQKFDRCSKRVWATKTRVDHSLNRDANGDIWGVKTPDLLLLFDQYTGKIKRTLKMKSWAQSSQIDPLGLRQYDSGHRSKWINHGGGYWHPNDAEPLPADYADVFPQFETGDLLISFRSINAIFVASPKTMAIKWWRIGAWRRQHDPDWQPDGTITVFNNNAHRSASSIIRIDPKTYQHEVIFDGHQEQFYTWMRGKHEVLPNGHITVSSPQQGRVFEVTAEGEVVFEFVNRYDPRHALLVSELLTLPTNYFKSKVFADCPVQLH